MHRSASLLGWCTFFGACFLYLVAGIGRFMDEPGTSETPFLGWGTVLLIVALISFGRTEVLAQQRKRRDKHAEQRHNMQRATKQHSANVARRPTRPRSSKSPRENPSESSLKSPSTAALDKANRNQNGADAQANAASGSDSERFQHNRHETLEERRIREKTARDAARVQLNSEVRRKNPSDSPVTSPPAARTSRQSSLPAPHESGPKADWQRFQAWCASAVDQLWEVGAPVRRWQVEQDVVDGWSINTSSEPLKEEREERYGGRWEEYWGAGDDIISVDGFVYEYRWWRHEAGYATVGKVEDTGGESLRKLRAVELVGNAADYQRYLYTTILKLLD
jgi:hypothetical protein